MTDGIATHEQDQMQGQMREFAETLARDVAAHRAALISGGVPGKLANRLTEQFAASWLAAHVEMQAGMESIALYIGGEGDEDV